jgi:hypothetical protein
VFGDLPGPKWTVRDQEIAATQGWFIRRLGVPKASFDEAWDQLTGGGTINIKAGDPWAICALRRSASQSSTLTDAEAVALVDKRAGSGDKTCRHALAFIAYRRISGEVD